MASSSSEPTAMQKWINSETNKPNFARHGQENLEARTVAASELIVEGFYHHAFKGIIQFLRMAERYATGGHHIQGRALQQHANAILKAKGRGGTASQKWAQRFMKRWGRYFHRRKAASRDVKRKAMQDRACVEAFFQDWSNFIARHDIRRENIWNFDETGFMVGYINKGTFLWTFNDIEKPVLSDSHETVSLFPLPPHLTHYLQPLDVGVFRSYKHWHQQVVYREVADGASDFGKTDFLYHLQEIRNRTFKKHTMLSTWEKCGLFPHKPSMVLDNLQDALSSLTKEVDKRDLPCFIQEGNFDQARKAANTLALNGITATDEMRRVKEKQLSRAALKEKTRVIGKYGPLSVYDARVRVARDEYNRLGAKAEEQRRMKKKEARDEAAYLRRWLRDVRGTVRNSIKETRTSQMRLQGGWTKGDRRVHLNSTEWLCYRWCTFRELSYKRKFYDSLTYHHEYDHAAVHEAADLVILEHKERTRSRKVLSLEADGVDIPLNDIDETSSNDSKAVDEDEGLEIDESTIVCRI
ncbi:hypothetical protein HRG_006688 [Hirsutella rhossiliensis]|uniref:HTH CENPB-type domain-containing protein n=1 Tax=Hirsutella rhossiliensis TaxID=111463 RepID=A0A9P8SJ12_9HYPO|nr:uncharacterized protein HRG_06688 [Hirsutella rhossiliensis]KAH0962586.1 hypothetical protein HRG_06688 [Hirsutella rhossiliensis]